MQVPEHHAAVEAHYRERLAALVAELRNTVTRRSRYRIVLAACAALFLYLALSSHPTFPQWTLAIPTIAFVASLPAYIGLQNQWLRIQRLRVFHDDNLRRVDGSTPQTGRTGDEFHTSSHLYGDDLNVLGKDSLFGLLATVRTGIGQRGLAQLLLAAATRGEVMERQRCIQELAPLTDLREEMALLGPSRLHDTPATAFDAWLEETPPTFHPAIRWAFLLLSLAVISLLFCGLLHRLPWSIVLTWLAACFALQSILFRAIRAKVLPILDASRNSAQIQLFADAVQILLKQRFASDGLQRLQQCLREPELALPALRRIENNFALVEQLQKEYAFVLSLLFSLGSHTAINIASWKRRYAESLRRWSTAWGEFEALMAVANYAFEHPGNVYPVLSSSQAAAKFRAVALAHPLLPAASCVRNDIALDAETRFYLVSGSNMAGKSTLLRAIGLNAVLAYAGAPVCAASLELGELAVGASLSITDSLADGKSKFLAEVERLSAILEVSRTRPTLFLIDEIFSGTNSHDRAIAAEAVLRDLLRNGAIGALSTHDLVLTSLATAENRGVNVHMASPDAQNPLAFDFLLKPGVNPSSNALAIVRMMGINPDAIA